LKDADYKALKRHVIDDTGIIEVAAMSDFVMNAITIAEARQVEIDAWAQ
jgi:hypothetical protein